MTTCHMLCQLSLMLLKNNLKISSLGLFMGKLEFSKREKILEKLPF